MSVAVTDLMDGGGTRPPIPYSIRLFERLQISAMLIGWADATFAYRTLLHGRISPILFLIALLTITGVVAMLVFQIARRRSSASKWILIVLSAIAVAPWFELLKRSGVGDFASMLALFQGALQIASLALLVTESARGWFESRLD